MRYLTLDELIYINGTVLNSREILGGTKKIRDIALLEAAAARPTTTVFGEDAYPTLQEKVAALLHSIARNHPFTDGNKRTATVAALFMLEVNGLRATWNPAEALAAILALAEGKGDMKTFAVWLPTEPCPTSLEQDAETDMQTIARLISAHRWLLDELATR